MSDEHPIDVDEILESLVDANLAGQHPDIEQLFEKYPQLADQLRSRWTALQRLHDNIGPLLQLSNSPLPAGTCLGDFQIIREIGRGGMGVVYEAEQRIPHRRVALKVLSESQVDPIRTPAIFHREIDALARLKHVGIAAIHSAVSNAGDTHAFAMELVEGIPLIEYCRSRSLPDRLDIFQRICDAVAYAHQRGVIHRDIKPSNVLVDNAGQPKVLDFGLARIMDAEGAPVMPSIDKGRIQGTLRYMSPEQAGGDSDAIDVRTDVYSLGVVLFELLTGRPFVQLEGKSVTESIRIICEAESVSPSTYDGRLKGDLDVITLKATAKLLSDRYQAVSDLSDDISRHRQLLPIRARPTKSYVKVLKAIRRRPMRAALATMVLLLLGLAVPAVDGYRKARSAAREEALSALRDRALLSVHLLTHPAERPLKKSRRDQLQAVVQETLPSYIKANPRSAWPYLMRARLHLADPTTYSLVIADLDVAQGLEPRYASPSLMRFYLETLGQQHPSKREFNWDGVPYPTDFDDLFFCGMYSQKLFDAERARTFYSAALGLRPSDYWARLERARVTPMSMSEARVADARLCTQLRPELSPGWMLLQAWLHIKGDTDESNRILIGMRDRFPQDLNVIRTLADRFEQLGQFDEEESVLRSALNQCDSDVLRGTLGNLLVRLGRWDEGLESLNSAIADCSTEWCDLWTAAKAMCLRDQGDLDGACEILRNRISDVGTSEVPFRALLARIELQRGNSENALGLFLEELSVEHDRQIQLATVVPEIVPLFESLGRREEIQGLLERELEQATSRHGALSELTKQVRKQLLHWLWKQGDLDRIDDLLHEHIQANPTSPEPFIEAGQFYSEIGKPEEAVKAFSLGLGLESTRNVQKNQFLRSSIARSFVQCRRPVDACIQYSIARSLDLKVDTHDKLMRIDWAEFLLDNGRWSEVQDQQLRNTIFFRSCEAGTDLRGEFAVQILVEQVKLVGDSLKAAHYRGRAYERLNKRDEALHSYEIAMHFACRSDVRDSLDDLHAKSSPGFSHYRRRFLRDYCRVLVDRDGTVTSALEVCKRAACEFPGPIAQETAYVVLAELQLSGDDCDSALISARKACDLIPEDEEAWVVLGNAYRAAGDRDAAVDAWVNAMEHSFLGFSGVEPQLFQVLISEGVRQEDYDRAYRLAMKFVKSRRMTGVDTATADDMQIIDLFYLVSACAHVGRVDEAVGYLKQWLEITKRDGGVNDRRSSQLATMQNLAEKNGEAELIDECERVRQDLEGKAVQVIPGEAFARSGSMLLVLGKLDLAKSMLQESYKRRLSAFGFSDVKTVVALEYLADVCNLKGDWLEAETYANAAIGTIAGVLDSEHPRLLGPLGQLALALYEQGELDEAEVAADKAIRIFRKGDTNAIDGALAALEIRGMIDLDCGFAESAEVELREAVERRKLQQKDDDELLARTESLLGECLLELGRLVEAEQVLVESIPRMWTDTPLQLRRWERASGALMRVRLTRNGPDAARVPTHD